MVDDEVYNPRREYNLENLSDNRQFISAYLQTSASTKDWPQYVGERSSDVGIVPVG